MDLDEIEGRLITVLAAFEQKLPQEQLDDMQDLARHREPGIALENLCSQIFEYDVATPMAVHDELAVLGRAMGISSDYWMRLRTEADPDPTKAD